MFSSDLTNQRAAHEIYRTRPIEFLNDWVWILEPRNVERGLPTTLPLTLRPGQVGYVNFLLERTKTKTSGLVEKSRDEGMTWVTLGLFLHYWLFKDGFRGGIGSRKLDLVDKKGDMDSIFEKLRFMVRHLPKWLLPPQFNLKDHSPYGLLNNPYNGSSITGEGGNNIGRGGRTSIYFVDEYAFLEDPESVDLALSQNTDTVIYGSTSNGVNNRFYQLRMSGKYSIYTLSWKNNPDKNYTMPVEHKGQVYNVQPWYQLQKAKLDPLVLAQEVDIDYNHSTVGALLPRAWVDAAFEYKVPSGSHRQSSVDVGDDGQDLTTYAARAGSRVIRVTALNKSRAPEQAERYSREDNVSLMCYDRIGVGASIAATVGKKEGLPFQVRGTKNSEEPTDTLYPDNPRAKAGERFFNYGSEQWWRLRLRFQNTFENLYEGKFHPPDECISFVDADLDDPERLKQELCQITYAKHGVADKVRVDKFGGTNKSPNYADAVMLSFAKPNEKVSSKLRPKGKKSKWGRP